MLFLERVSYGSKTHIERSTGLAQLRVGNAAPVKLGMVHGQSYEATGRICDPFRAQKRCGAITLGECGASWGAGKRTKITIYLVATVDSYGQRLTRSPALRQLKSRYIRCVQGRYEGRASRSLETTYNILYQSPIIKTLSGHNGSPS